jgi:molybdopterin synthase catalytic subunit
MRVDVLLFAHYADQLGTSVLRLELPDGASLADAVAAVRARPGAERIPEEPLAAVNERWAPGGHLLGDGDTVALLPPVAGG